MRQVLAPYKWIDLLMCAYGTSYQIYTTAVSSAFRLAGLQARCQCTLPNIQLQGFLTSLAGANPPRLARRAAELTDGDGSANAEVQGPCVPKEDRREAAPEVRSPCAAEARQPDTAWEADLCRIHGLAMPDRPRVLPALPSRRRPPWEGAAKFTWCKSSIDTRAAAARQQRKRAAAPP